MKVFMVCRQCVAEGLAFGVSLVEVTDNFQYELVCSHGHRSTSVLQQLRFEVLFEIGTNAILDGYYREAVVSFASSLERFYEFAIMSLLRGDDERRDLPEQCWKPVAKSSERQLGVFIGAWAFAFGKCPTVLSNDWASFRNNVVHNGEIPSKAKAVEFGEVILKQLRSQMGALTDNYGERVNREVSRHVRSFQPKSTSPVGTMYQQMLICLQDSQSCEPARQTLEAYLEFQASVRKLLSQATVPVLVTPPGSKP